MSRKLTKEAQVFVVQALACYDPPREVVRQVKEAFGIDMSPQLVETYDPTKYAGRDVAKRWRDLFDATRQRYKDETQNIGIAHRVVRLRMLQRMIEKAEAMGAIALAAQLLEQAAKEVGDCYTNKHRHEVAVPHAHITLNLAGEPR